MPDAIGESVDVAEVDGLVVIGVQGLIVLVGVVGGIVVVGGIGVVGGIRMVDDVSSSTSSGLSFLFFSGFFFSHVFIVNYIPIFSFLCCVHLSKHQS